MSRRGLVCGDRHATDREAVFRVLDNLHALEPFSVIIHGGATGVDTFADEWAKSRGVPVSPYPVSAADWKMMGPAAGPIRNRMMLTNGRPDVVIAMPGNDGTADMVKQTKLAGVKMLDYRVPAYMLERRKNR